MKSTTCPSCGLVTEQPHETQEACIEALHGEIARIRDVLRKVKEPGSERLPDAAMPARRFESQVENTFETKGAA